MKNSFLFSKFISLGETRHLSSLELSVAIKKERMNEEKNSKVLSCTRRSLIITEESNKEFPMQIQSSNHFHYFSCVEDFCIFFFY
jgi:hypothetical protein